MAVRNNYTIATLNACTYRFDATITFAICTIVFVTWKYKNRN